MALSDHKRRLPAMLVAAAAMFALAACDDQSTAQRDDTTVPQADQQLPSRCRSNRPTTS